MQSSSITKYEFRIRTRTGVLVEKLALFGQDEEDARRKLRQMYNDCEILASHCQQGSLVGRHGHLNYEDVVDLIVTA